MMKKIICLLLILQTGLVLFAQEDLSITNKKMSVDQAKKVQNKRMDRVVINLNGTNWFHHETGGFVTKWYSRGIDLYFTWDMPIKKSFVSFAPGIGYSSVNIYDNSKLVQDSAGSHFSPYANYASDFKKTKISLGYIDVPLELRFRTKPLAADMRFKVAIGFKFGIKVDGYTKDKRKDLSYEGGYHKYVEKGYIDFNQWRLGPTFRIGFGPVNLNLYYGLLNVFKTGRGPYAREFAVGLSINGL